MTGNSTLVLASTGKSTGSSFADRRSCNRRSRRLHQISILAAKEFGDRLRSGWVVACVLVWLGAIGLTSFFGLLQIGHLGMQGYERTVISLLNLVQYLVPLLGLLLGFDLIVGEKEEPTLRLAVAAGVSRNRFLLGKFAGGCLTLVVPLALGFTIAGVGIGFAAKDTGVTPFFKLAVSGMATGVLFLGLGLMISTFSRTRVQALVLALLTWCFAVFVFDLVVLGMMLSTKSASAAREIEFVCDATHVNAAADLHSAYDNVSDRPRQTGTTSDKPRTGWLALNPLDLFRAMNLPQEAGVNVPAVTVALGMGLWLLVPLGVSAWKLNETDL